MVVTTSSKFACATSSGTDWRDTSKKVLEALESIRTGDKDFSLGFIYITSELSGNLDNILNLFRSVTGVSDWIGGVSKVVYDIQGSYQDVPAISVMLARVQENDFMMLPGALEAGDKYHHAVQSWAEDNAPLTCLVHSHPKRKNFSKTDLARIHEIYDSFSIGGILDGGAQSSLIANESVEDEWSGVLFSSSVDMISGLARGYHPVSKKLRVTRASDKLLMEIDNQPAIKVLDDIIQGSQSPHISYSDLALGCYIHNSDMEEYLVDNIIGFDSKKGWITLSHGISSGARICFVKKDPASTQKELSRMMLNLRERFQKRYGRTTPKAGIYIQAAGNFTGGPIGQNHEAGPGLIREILGEFPLTGFQSCGEISNGRLYEHAGILILLS